MGERMWCQTANDEQPGHQRGKMYITKRQAGEGDERWNNEAKGETTCARPVSGAQ